MKQLFLIRHGKATHELMPDIKRYLTEKGIKRTTQTAEILAKKNIYPDLIVSSPAVRAIQTAEILANYLNYDRQKIQINSTFYFYSKLEVLDQIKEFSDKNRLVFMVGHNPIWTEIADEFSQNGLFHLKTSGVFGTKAKIETWKKFVKAEKTDVLRLN